MQPLLEIALPYIFFKDTNENCSFLRVKLHILHFLPRRLLQGSKLLGDFFSKRFNEKSTRTKVALNFVQKKVLSKKNTPYFHFSQIATP